MSIILLIPFSVLFLFWCIYSAVNQSEHCLGSNYAYESDLNTLQNSVTRKAGGRKEADKEMQVCDNFLCMLIIYLRRNL